MNENSKSVYKSLRDSLNPDTSLTLTEYGADGTRTFDIIGELGDGGNVIAYKVKYDGADISRYMYVLKEVYPVPSEPFRTLRRGGESGLNLEIDKYDVSYYQSCRSAFEDLYRLQNEMSGSSDTMPAGLYEDRNSGKNGVYALYGLFRYSAGETLDKYRERSLYKLIDIQRKIAEIIETYHERGYLWLDIREKNVSITGAGKTNTVSMYDFGSIVSMDVLTGYKYDDNKPDFLLSFSIASDELLLPFELECLTRYSGNNTADNRFMPADPLNITQNLNAIGLYGRSTDIFLLGVLLFRRLYGYTPAMEICKDIQCGRFDITSSHMLRLCSDRIKEAICIILKKTLAYEDIEMRYENVAELLEAYNTVSKMINTDMEHSDPYKAVSRDFR